MTVIIGSYEVLIDDKDAHFLSLFKWRISKKSNTNYVIFNTTLKGRKGVMYRLHRYIMGVENEDWKKVVVDHINGNGLDNRRCNLRLSNLYQNQQNRKSKKRYKGIDFHKSDKKFRARISVNGKRIELGHFETEKEAAIAYNNAAIVYHGEFARLNQID